MQIGCCGGLWFRRPRKKREAKRRLREEKEGIFTPYAPPVLTLRGPRAAMSLGWNEKILLIGVYTRESE
jgi:hypothetical protein